MKKISFIILILLIGSMAVAQVRETTYYDDGSFYSGQRDGKGPRNGDGTMTWVSGDRYEGQWKKGTMASTVGPMAT